MQFIAGTTEFRLGAESAAAIGKFDGIHRGHKLLLEQILACKREGLIAAVFTFDPSPASFFCGKEVKELTTREEKRRRFASMGVDALIEFPLNGRTASMPPEQFIEEVFVQKMRARFIAAGTDLSFGYEGKGDGRLLKSMERRFNYRVNMVDKLCEGGREISSTYVREQVEAGRMEEAARLIGEPYGIIGEVVHGRKLGRTIGIPTVNLLPEPRKLLPPNGVYYSLVRWNGKVLRGVTNIGSKPTVSALPVIGAETYLYDFGQEIYGQKLEVSLLHYVRQERRFAGVEELRRSMEKDIEQGKEYFATCKQADYPVK